MARPNILVLMADQLNPKFLGAYGDKVSQSPTIDRLAQEGVVFDSAYCNSPLCAPARYSFLTGKLASVIGAFDNACELPASTPTVAHYLREADYHTILAGKMHFCGPEQLHGFEERLTTDIYPADFGWVPNWQRPHERQQWYHNMRSVTEAGPCVRSNQLDFDDEVVFATRQKLYDLARASEQRPFFLVASLTHPHDPFAISQTYWDRFEGAPIAPPRVPAGAAPDDPHSARLRAMCQLRDDKPTPEQITRARRAYYGAIAYVDDQFAAILQTLRDTGQADNTIVVVVSDHGESLGERGLWYKMNFYEGGSRVPLIVHAPNTFTHRRVAASVSLVDVLPTLLELCGIALPGDAVFSGRSLVAHMRGQGARDEVFGEYLAEGALAPIVMIRRSNYKFIHSPTDPDLLFDLSADPDELNNLAGSASHQVLVHQLRQEVELRWNFSSLGLAVLRSQQQRRLIFSSESKGKRRHWDYQPVQDASQRYIRSHLHLDDLEARARFPRTTEPL